MDDLQPGFPAGDLLDRAHDVAKEGLAERAALVEAVAPERLADDAVVEDEVDEGLAVLFVNGITGQGAFMLARYCLDALDIQTLRDRKLRFTMPAAICSYCTGETLIGEMYQMGMVKRMEFDDASTTPP